MQEISWVHIAKGTWINVGNRFKSGRKVTIPAMFAPGVRNNVRIAIDSNATIATIGDMGSNRTGLAMGLAGANHHHHVIAAFS